MYDPSEVKILHIHSGSENSFIEFVVLRTGKIWILKEDSFIKRFGHKLIGEFK